MRSFLFILMVISFSSANATQITPVSVTGSGSFNNSTNLLMDNYVPGEWTRWTNSSNVWWVGSTPKFTFDLGALYRIDEVLLSVDNNDDYSVQWSVNSDDWNNLFSINRGVGEVGWGMDTMSTDILNPEYISSIDFASVNAQYLRIYATGGDNLYSVGEFQVFGQALPSVPEPASLALMLLGLTGLGYKHKKFS